MQEYIKLIEIGDTQYAANGIIDNDAKVVWTQDDSTSLMTEKKLSGSYILYRSMNEALYDAIMDFTHCGNGYIHVYEGSVAPENLVVLSKFSKRDIEYDLDRCTLKITPKYYDPTGFKALLEKDFNIITEDISTFPFTYYSPFQFEFISCSADSHQCPDLDLVDGKWLTTSPVHNNDVPKEKYYCPTNSWNISPYEFGSYGWTLYNQVNVFVGYSGDLATPTFDITTTWFREVKLLLKATNEDLTPPPQGTSAWPFAFLEEVTINGVIYNKYYRRVDLVDYVDTSTDENNTEAGVTFYNTDYYGKDEGTRQLTRGRKLIDVLDWFREKLGLTTLVSDFFTNATNPISGKDLRYTMIMQKSDAIFVEGVERSDAATNGKITFKALMEQLWAMFQVTYYVDGTTLYIEHIDFFKNNMSYSSNSVGVDLTTEYPDSVKGKNKYGYEGSFPLREKFSFMESWNLDFVGADIDYSPCIDEGDSVEITAPLITTDIDITYIDSASNDGFVLFNVEDFPETIGEIIVHHYRVINETGKLSGIALANAHFSWANLHHYYYMTNRPLTQGLLNNTIVNFTKPQKLRKQVSIEFPYCLSLVDDIVNKLITTYLGDGQITSAEYSFKTGNLKIDLNYD